MTIATKTSSRCPATNAAFDMRYVAHDRHVACANGIGVRLEDSVRNIDGVDCDLGGTRYRAAGFPGTLDFTFDATPSARCKRYT